MLVMRPAPWSRGCDGRVSSGSDLAVDKELRAHGDVTLTRGRGHRHLRQSGPSRKNPEPVPVRQRPSEGQPKGTLGDGEPWFLCDTEMDNRREP
ncbi:hypothetical protein NDU88_009529 [Pleurodeles waltl]|uniref:Uncharacterized protein n=1 Tax=Pleurodeles waltl TaxID=8319 RepID=A0AAV7P2N9_PLEWA|nr:hypothetical protein NDU88_009529 [Pleurodeles waltl]